MIASLTGELRRVDEDRVHLKCGPILYELLVPAADLTELQASLGEELTFHTIFYLAGDPTRGGLDPTLIGFLRADDKKSDKSSSDKPDYAKLLVGTWEATKADKDSPVPVGLVAELRKDGSFKVTWKSDEREKTGEGMYKLDGDKLMAICKPTEFLLTFTIGC